MMTNAEYLAKYLEARNVTHVYELIGGMITFLLDAIHRGTAIKIVSMHHEQGAAFAAEGWARIKGTAGVAFATSGPGATNLITGIGSCYFDSVPTVFITGQVNRHEQKGSKQVRQLGFQETDIVSMVRPITKAAWLVNDPEELPRLLDEAFRLAESGRPGPVLLDIPMDVQRHVLAAPPRISPPASANTKVESGAREKFLVELKSSLGAAAKPLILAGGGVRSSKAADVFRSLVSHLNIPVVHSLMGVDALSESHPQRIGMIGSYGNRWANQALALSDFILVLGSRLDIRQTGSDVDGFRGRRSFFHVDCDPAEVNNRVQGCAAWTEELTPFLRAARSYLPAQAGYRKVWFDEISALRESSPDTGELEAAKGINPNKFIRDLSLRMNFAGAFITDVGQHQMWAAQSVRLLAHQRFITSGGMGSMGFGLPSAIGASFAAGACILITGDGGFQCNIQELQTIVRNKLPIKIIVINNQCHGMVRQFQESYFKERYQSTLWGYDTPSFAAVGSAYGLRSITARNEIEATAAIEMICASPNEPFLLEVMVDSRTNAYPKLAFGRPFGEMEPSVAPLEMEGT